MNNVKTWKSDFIHHITNMPIIDGFSIKFMKDGKLHNEGFPAIIDFNDYNIIVDVSYYINGKEHREDGPAYVLYSSNCDFRLLRHNLCCKFHQENKYDNSAFYVNGNIMRKVYYINGECHRAPVLSSSLSPPLSPLYERGEKRGEKKRGEKIERPARITYYSNGNLELVIYKLYGELHRENGPAEIGWYKNGNIKLKKYYINGKLHRSDGHACIGLYIDGKINYEEYYLNNKCHREDGPYFVNYYESGKLRTEIWGINGKNHREGGPSYSLFDSEGIPIRLCYHINDVLHRPSAPVYILKKGKLINTVDYGPARIQYYNGKIMREEYYEHGLLHRPSFGPNSGPAYIEYNGDNKMTIQIYYKNGLKHRSSKQGPAVIIMNQFNSNFIEKLEYWKNGVLHRPQNEGPAKIKYNTLNNTIEKECYYYNGLKSRINNKPAIIKYNWFNRKISSEHYYIKGRQYSGLIKSKYNNDGLLSYELYKIYHMGEIISLIKKYYPDGISIKSIKYKSYSLNSRLDGPARIKYYENGNIRKEEYLIGGKRHGFPTPEGRNGPAIIKYNISGTISERKYYYNGIRLKRGGNRVKK